MSYSPGRDLLINNDVYMRALEKKSIPVTALGFKELKYSCSERYLKSSKPLLAVIPDEHQTFLMDHVSKRLRQYQETRSLLRVSQRLGSSKALSTEVSPPPPKKPVKPRLDDDGKPRYAKLPSTWRTEEQKKADDAEYWSTVREHQRKIGVYYPIVEDGVEYVYNYEGKRMTLDEFERSKEERKPEVYSSDKPVFEGNIIEKTSNYVNKVRSLTDRLKQGKVKWTPKAFPASTVRTNTRRSFILPESYVTMWPEYQNLGPGDVLVTVEHCCDCAHHDWITHHDEDQYRFIAGQVQETLESVAKVFQIRYFSLIKPIQQPDPLEVSKLASAKRNSDRSKAAAGGGGGGGGGDVDEFGKDKKLRLPELNSSRIGAFEVQIAWKGKNGGRLQKHLLHSKLLRGSWPCHRILKRDVYNLLNATGFELLPGVGELNLDATEENPGNSGNQYPKHSPKKPNKPKNTVEKVEIAPVFDNRPQQLLENLSIDKKQTEEKGGSKVENDPEKIPENVPEKRKVPPLKKSKSVTMAMDFVDPNQAPEGNLTARSNVSIASHASMNLASSSRDRDPSGKRSVVVKEETVVRTVTGRRGLPMKQRSVRGLGGSDDRSDPSTRKLTSLEAAAYAVSFNTMLVRDVDASISLESSMMQDKEDREFVANGAILEADDVSQELKSKEQQQLEEKQLREQKLREKQELEERLKEDQKLEKKRKEQQQTAKAESTNVQPNNTNINTTLKTTIPPSEPVKEPVKEVNFLPSVKGEGARSTANKFMESISEKTEKTVDVEPEPEEEEFDFDERGTNLAQALPTFSLNNRDGILSNIQNLQNFLQDDSLQDQSYSADNNMDMMWDNIDAGNV